MFRRTLRAPARFSHDAQVVGADVPSFSRYPYLAQEVLQLYRRFWRLVYLHPPAERADLIFKLRNEFRSKRYLAGPRAIGHAVRFGQGKAEMYRQLLETRHVRMSGTHAAPRRPKWEQHPSNQHSSQLNRHRNTSGTSPSSLQTLKNGRMASRNSPRSSSNNNNSENQAVLADALWERIRGRSGSTVPGLREDLSSSKSARETVASVQRPYVMASHHLHLMPPKTRKLRHR